MPAWIFLAHAKAATWASLKHSSIALRNVNSCGGSGGKWRASGKNFCSTLAFSGTKHLQVSSQGEKKHQSYRHSKTALNIAWDMLRVAILWHIWCAQSMAVFRKKIFNVVEVCLLAWRNTIYAGMESHSRLLSTINSYCSERHSTLCAQFNLIGVNNKFSIHAMLEIPSGSLY